MRISLLSIFIVSSKIVSLICLLISIHSYHWFQIENYSGLEKMYIFVINHSLLYLANKLSIESLCMSYGAFCNINDQMPLPRLIVIIPCVLTAMGLLLEIINLSLLCSIWQRVKSMLNFCLGKIEIELF